MGIEGKCHENVYVCEWREFIHHFPSVCECAEGWWCNALNILCKDQKSRKISLTTE